MNALTKLREFETVDASFNITRDPVPLPLIATQVLFAAEDACRADPPRRKPWRDEPTAPWYSRFAAAVGHLLEPRKPRYPLTEHLCRDIGLEWRPEPPVRTWPW